MKQDDAEIRTELVISEILRWGVRASLCLILFGCLLWYFGGGAQADVHALVSTGGAFPLSPRWILGGVFHLDGLATIVLGLALLIATPVLRVVAAIVSFALRGDRTYALISSLVLAFVLLSFVLGLEL